MRSLYRGDKVFVGFVDRSIGIFIGINSLIRGHEAIGMASSKLDGCQFCLYLANFVALVTISVCIASGARVKRSILVVTIDSTAHAKVSHLVLDR